ncbi:UNVERIFIED_CONTAM: Polyol transporter 5 [Sesamum latifolium]|uniref:Polyol transporter 5 n=1 Tax=Sesamum latifolium TaxID=2727402 RepID=A0AAW2VCZ7_9LAMI
MESRQRGRARLNKYALACALLASTNSVLLGYGGGFGGSLNVFSLIGSLASGKTSDWIGRRYTIVLAAATFFLGALLMGLAPSYPFLVAGRVVSGVGVGYSLMIAPVYTAEVSPAVTRGFLTSLPEVFINVGILLGYIVNYGLSGLSPRINWRLMLGLAAVPAVAIACCVMAMPESPRWLIMKGRTGEAKRVLERTSESEEEAEVRLEQITKAAASSHENPASNTWHGKVFGRSC